MEKLIPPDYVQKIYKIPLLLGLKWYDETITVFLWKEGRWMPSTPHIEKHFTASDTVRDIVIGMADGLTVPFALAAGLTGAVDSTTIIITAGVAEVAAGSIAMGLGGYLAAKTDGEHYKSELKREQMEIVELTHKEEEETAEIFREYGLKEEQIQDIINTLKEKPDQWADFMMKFELGLEKPNPKQGRKSAFTIALSYIIGGSVPIFPYFFIDNQQTALMYSVIITLIVLFIFGFVKGKFTGAIPLKSGLQTMMIGGLAAGAAFGLARLLS